MNYAKIYDSLIFRAVSETRKRYPQNHKDYIYFERHHILPKCLNGSNDKSNLVLLTPGEHFLAHLLLVKMHPSNLKIIWAATMMSACNGKNKRNTNKTYSWIRKLQSKLQTGKKLSEETKEKMSASAKGKTKGERSLEHRQNISIANTGRKFSKEVIEQRAKHLRGKPLSEDHKLKISNANKGKPKNNQSAEAIKKRSESNRGKKRSAEFCKKSSERQKGEIREPLSIDTKSKISAALVGKEKPRMKCVCGKEGSVGHLKRWHKDHFVLIEPGNLI